MWNIRSEDPDMSDRIEFRMWDIQRRWNVGRTEFFPGWNELCRASQGGPSACARCRDPSPWWHGARIAIRSNSIRIPWEDMRSAPLSGLPQGEAHDTREHHTPDDSISYPDHWLKWASLATSFRKPTIAHVPPPSNGVSGRPVRTSFAGKIEP